MFKKFPVCAAAVFLAAAVWCAAASAQVNVGVYGVNQYALGTYASYALGTAGGGVAAEYALPLLFLKNFGIAARVQAAGVIPASGSGMSAGWDASAAAGAWVKFPFRHGLSLQPEADWGVWLDSLDGTLYADQLIQLSCAVRYAPEKPEEGRLTFELAPVYTFMPEQDTYAVNMAGIRAGVLCRLGHAKGEK